MPDTAEQRAAFLDRLRALHGLIATNPDLPVPSSVLAAYWPAGDEAARFAEVKRVAHILHEPTRLKDNRFATHRDLGENVTYSVIAIASKQPAGAS